MTGMEGDGGGCMGWRDEICRLSYHSTSGGLNGLVAVHFYFIALQQERKREKKIKKISMKGGRGGILTYL